MIEEKDLMMVGKFLKPHALKGELNVITEIDPDILEEDYPIVVSIDGIFVPFYIDSFRRKGSFGSLIKIDGVDSADDARKFVNKEFYMLRRDVAEFFDLDEDEVVMADDFAGYDVYDKHAGYIGKVSEVDDSTENVLLIVKPDDSEDVTYLPFVDDFIVAITPDEENGGGRIDMDLPDGVLTLNEKL